MKTSHHHSRLPLSSALLFALAFAFQPITARATTYYFANAGSDTNSGLTSTSAKQTLRAAEALALPGNTLLFKRGDAWYDPFTSFDLQYVSGTSANPIVLDAFPSTGTENDRPVIAALQPLNDATGSAANQWKLAPAPAPAGTWQQSVKGFSHALRLFVNKVSRYQVNRSNQAKNETDVDQTYEWYLKPTEPGSDGIVYLNTGSTTVAPQKVEIHPMGSVSTLKLKGTNYVTLRNIDFRGGSTANVIWIEAPCSNITIDSCTIQEANGSGIVAINSGPVTTDVISNLTIKNNHVNKVWTTYENDPAITLRGDGIFLLHAVQTGVIQNNQVHNWGHCGITLTSYRAGFPGVHSVVVEQNKIYADASGYMHGFDVSGFENLTTNNTIRQNFIHDLQATCHALGNHNKFYSNIFARVTMTTMPLHSHQPYGLDMMPWPVDGIYIVAHDNLVAQNTFYDIEQYPIILSDTTASPTPVNNNRFYNNLLADYANPPPTAGSPDVGIYVQGSVRGDTYVRYNNLWDSLAGGAPGSVPVAYYLTGTYTATALNAHSSGDCSGNSQLDAQMYDPDGNLFYLKSTAPASLKASNNPLDPLLGVTNDFFGVPFDTAHPTIGAVQVP